MRRVKWSNVEEDDEMGNLSSGRSEERALDHGAWSMEQLARAKPRYRTVSGWRLGPTTLQKFDKRITGSNKVQWLADRRRDGSRLLRPLSFLAMSDIILPRWS